MKDIPFLYRALYRRAMSGCSRKAAICAQCLECCGWVRLEVTLCTDVGCALFPYRPYSSEDAIDAAKRSADVAPPPLKTAGVGSRMDEVPLQGIAAGSFGLRA